ncbi:hypothetical protein ABFA07_020999 [Porites harrisoni]
MFKLLRIIVLNLSFLILLNGLVNAGEEREVRQIHPFEDCIDLRPLYCKAMWHKCFTDVGKTRRILQRDCRKTCMYC